MTKINVGDSFGKWEIVKKIGSGGNGFVYEVREKGEERAALKILLPKSASKKCRRFANEIQIQTILSGKERVLPVIDSYTSEDPAIPSWYVMPLATQITGAKPDLSHRKNPQTGKPYLSQDDVERIVFQMHGLALTLSDLHDQGIMHRDIKPQNILEYSDKWCFADFGLVSYDKKVDLTSTRERVGPNLSMAPEMRRNAHNADSKSADIYLMGKTLWMLLANKEDGFDGPYKRDDPSLTLTQFYQKPDSVSLLDELLERSTANLPDDRPTAREFSKRLEEWIKLSKNYNSYNLDLWGKTIRELFSFGVPQIAKWTNIDEINKVLNHIATRSSGAHIMYPSGGGMHFEGIEIYDRTERLFELSQLRVIAKIAHIELHCLSSDPNWQYFWIQTEKQEPIRDRIHSESTRKNRYFLEEVTELEYNHFEPFPDPEHPSTTRDVRRVLEGAFIIVAETSIYNGNNDTYDGRHATMTSDGFHQYMTQQMRRIASGSL